MQLNSVRSGVDDVREKLKLWALWLKGTEGMARLSCGSCVESIMKHTEEFGPNRPEFDQNDEPEALEVEVAMCKLKTFDRRLFKALMYEYYFELTNKEAAQRLKCSLPTFKTWRANAESFIAGRIF